MRLVSCEYEHPSARETVWGAREHFLDMVGEFAPKAIDDLHGKPFECFLQTGIAELELSQRIAFSKGTYRSISRFWRSFENGSQSCVYITPSELEMRFLHEPCAERTKSKLDKLRSGGVLDDIDFLFEPDFRHLLPCPNMVSVWKSLKDWAGKYNLTPKGSKNWCLQSGFHTLDVWARHSAKYHEIGLLYYDTKNSPPRVKSLDVPVGFDEWRPDFQDREDYMKDLKRNLKTELSEMTFCRNPHISRRVRGVVTTTAERYCDQVEEYYRSNGWKKIRDKKKLLEHLEWAVTFQLGSNTFSSIAEAKDVEVSSVKKEVEKILDLIDLVRRPVRRGRGTGQKESAQTAFLKRLAR